MYKFGLTFFKVALPILVMPYVYRQIIPEDMGRVGYVLTVMTYFYILGDFGLYIYGFREVILLKEKRETLNKFFSETFLLRSSINFCILILYLCFVLMYNDSDISPLFYYIAGIQIIGTFFNVEWFYEGLEKFRFITIKTIIIRIISVLLIFIYVRGEEAPLYYLLITSLFVLFNNIFSFLILLKKKIVTLSYYGKMEIRSHLKRMGYIFITINGVMLFFQLDKLILGMNDDLVGVGFYSLNERIITIITSLLFSVIVVLTPRLGENLINNPSEYSLNIKKSLNIIYLLLFPLTFFIFSTSFEILYIIGGKDYINSKSLLQLFSIYIITYTLLEVIKSNILILYRRERIYFIIILAAGIINLIIKILFGEDMSANIILLTTLIVSVLATLLLGIYIKKTLNINLLQVEITRYFIISLPLFLLGMISIDSVFISLLTKISIAGIYYFSMLLLIKDKILNEILQRLSIKAGK